jgi:hypothetical protein
MDAQPLGTTRRPSELLVMSSTTSRATWLPAAIARAAVVNSPNVRTSPAGPRHLAPETPGEVRIAMPEDFTRTGRHAEPEGSRGLHDPVRDEVDFFARLGFGRRR